METEDPRAALDAADVPTRSAAARDLARIGGWSDVELLVKKANDDRSAAVRLYAAAAAADIVARHRGAAGQKALTAAQKKQIHDWVRAIDPGSNPGLLMMLSAVADDVSVDRLGRMLRDPRNGVRAGAAMAIRRMALSGAPPNGDKLRTAAQSWLEGARLPADAVLELIKLAGEAGWTGLEALLKKAAVHSPLHAEAVDEAKKRLTARNDPATWQGFWMTDGLDIMEVSEQPRLRAWGALVDGGWHTADGRAAFGDGKVDGRPVRLVYAARVGDPDVRLAALQIDGRTWWKQEGKDLVAAMDEWIDAIADAAVLEAVGKWLEAVDGPLAVRARAIVRLQAGDAKGAVTLLEELAAHKKPRNDVYWLLGKAQAAAGQKKKAKEALDLFLEKTAKKADFRKEAEALRKKLGA